MLWSAFPDYAKVLQEKRENVKFLAGVPFPKNIQITSDLNEALAFSDFITLAIPTQFVRNVLHKVKDLPYQKKIFVTVSKGIEKQSGMRPSEILKSILGQGTPVVALSGPSHAEEVARGLPTLVVAASEDINHAKLVQETFADTYLRIYASNDLVGTELGGALKNVIAIAAGISDGLNFGDNTKSGLITRGLLEMTRLGIKLGANPNTFFGLSGIGDLMTTCFSEHGRNLKVGRELGRGKKIDDILSGMEMVAEGVSSAESVHALCQKVGVELPIINEVYAVLFEGKEPKKAVVDLLQRDAREEWKQA